MKYFSLFYPPKIIFRVFASAGLILFFLSIACSQTIQDDPPDGYDAGGEDPSILLDSELDSLILQDVESASDAAVTDILDSEVPAVDPAMPAILGTPQTTVGSSTTANISFTTTLTAATAIRYLNTTMTEELLLEGGTESITHTYQLTNLTPRAYYTFRIILRANGHEVTAGPYNFSTRSAKTRFNLLFDQSHDQTAGNAYWIVDDNAPDPSPASPSSAGSWKGGYSTWGYELWKTGKYSIKSFPAGQHFTYGQAGNLDLENFDVLVVPEPNTSFTSEEKSALIDFVRNGGGLLMIADHAGSDRNNDGLDSSEIWNELFEQNSFGQYPFSLKFYYTNITTDPCQTLLSLPDMPVVEGIYGTVQSFGIYAGGTLNIVAGAGIAKALAWMPGYQGEAHHVILAAGVLEAGRVFAVGDSSLFWDGTDKDEHYDAEMDAFKEYDNKPLAMNIIAWLAGE